MSVAHTMCKHGISIDLECVQCDDGELEHALRQLDVCMTERDRYRAALEEISDGDGCNSKYGPGCDTHCKVIARAALKGDQ